MNIAPATYIRRKKILMSLHDLKYGDKQVQSIANAYGFTSPQNYNRIFKNELGCTPTYCRIMFRQYGCFSKCNGVCKALNKDVQNP
ncbi:helix-turn-helix domain-containing protein [Citrobacter portucalensis]|uniref:helix-turn-helix domain-containing protein n=1 Tax=Citrobacter portucalensis TaxID=1639133 RepID=UPI00397BC87B